jgi:hypothetical protein
MFGVENLVLSRPLSSEPSNNNNNNNNINSYNSNNDSSFVSINSDLDPIYASLSSPQFINAYFNNNSSSSKNDLANRLDSMADCPAYLLPRLSYTNLSQSYASEAKVNASLTSKQSQSRNASIKSYQSTATTLTAVTAQSKFYYTDDFILLSEFSEIEGPKPLLTIPTDGGTGFNKNECSLHLMCVDFHSHLQFLQQSDTILNENNGGKAFSLTKDTSIINYWDSNASLVTACVQHFTLYDLEARGFVRPFCLAYISYDQKAVGFFDEIRAKFAEITDLFKKSNFNTFRQELEQRCVDLKFTREFFIKWSEFFDKQKLNVNPSREADSDDDKFVRVINKMIADYRLDERTVSRLNFSCSSESAKRHQFEAIDNMVSEMESINAVVMEELRSKRWLKTTSSGHANHDSLASSREDLNLNRFLFYFFNTRI